MRKRTTCLHSPAATGRTLTCPQSSAISPPSKQPCICLSRIPPYYTRTLAVWRKNSNVFLDQSSGLLRSLPLLFHTACRRIPAPHTLCRSILNSLSRVYLRRVHQPCHHVSVPPPLGVLAFLLAPPNPILLVLWLPQTPRIHKCPQGLLAVVHTQLQVI